MAQSMRKWASRDRCPKPSNVRRYKKIGVKRKNSAPTTLTDTCWVQSRISRFAKYPCSMKQERIQNPKYWKLPPKPTRTNFSGIANKGMESENTIDELNPTPKLGEAPRGKTVTGADLKNSHPRYASAESPPSNHVILLGLRTWNPTTKWKATSVSAKRVINSKEDLKRVVWIDFLSVYWFDNGDTKQDNIVYRPVPLVGKAMVSH